MPHHQEHLDGVFICDLWHLEPHDAMTCLLVVHTPWLQVAIFDYSLTTFVSCGDFGLFFSKLTAVR